MATPSHYTPRSDRPRFGENCPDPMALKTGDLLFPRRLGTAAHASSVDAWFALVNQLSDADDGHLSLRELFKRNAALEALNRNPTKANIGFVPDITRLRSPAKKEGGVTMTYAEGNAVPSGNVLEHPDYTSLLVDQYDTSHPVLDLHSLYSLPSMSQGKLNDWMAKILSIALPEIPEKWLNMSVEEFQKSAIWNFFLKALTSPDVRLSFFIGHVGIVLKEGGGTWVIEANITDYSHYRVAIHPYCVQEEVDGFEHHDLDGGLGSERLAKDKSAVLRGWVNRRTALGELVWWATPEHLTPNDITELPNIAKHYLGRPFGFFDHPDFGHSNRFYCAEFVLRVFRDIRKGLAVSVDDQRTWGGMLSHLNAMGDKRQAAFLQVAMNELSYSKEHEFFVLPPALLWRSAGLKQSTPSYTGGEQYA